MGLTVEKQSWWVYLRLAQAAIRFLLPALCDRLLLMQGDTVEFCLFKCQGLARSSQYQWQLVDQQEHSTQQLCVLYGGEGNIVQLQDGNNVEMIAVDLCRGAYFTVIKFAWANTSYRCAHLSVFCFSLQQCMSIYVYMYICTQQCEPSEAMFKPVSGAHQLCFVAQCPEHNTARHDCMICSRKLPMLACRWAMTRRDSSSSPTQLRIELLQEGCKECLACITGPGCRNSFGCNSPSQMPCQSNIQMIACGCKLLSQLA